MAAILQQFAYTDDVKEHGDENDAHNEDQQGQLVLPEERREEEGQGHVGQAPQQHQQIDDAEVAGGEEGRTKEDASHDDGEDSCEDDVQHQPGKPVSGERGMAK